MEAMWQLGGGGHHSSFPTPLPFFCGARLPREQGLTLPGEAASGCPPRERVIHAPLTKRGDLVLLQKN